MNKDLAYHAQAEIFSDWNYFINHLKEKNFSELINILQLFTLVNYELKKNNPNWDNEKVNSLKIVFAVEQELRSRCSENTI